MRNIPNDAQHYKALAERVRAAGQSRGGRREEAVPSWVVLAEVLSSCFDCLVSAN